MDKMLQQQSQQMEDGNRAMNAVYHDNDHHRSKRMIFTTGRGRGRKRG